MLGEQGQMGRAAASTFHSVIPSSARDLARASSPRQTSLEAVVTLTRLGGVLY
jgi:hypothetical protein